MADRRRPGTSSSTTGGGRPARSATCGSSTSRRPSRTRGTARLDAAPRPRGARPGSARTTAPRSPCATSTTCPVPEVAALLGRTVHATEALLVRARAAFRRELRATEPRGRAHDRPVRPCCALPVPTPRRPRPRLRRRLRARLDRAPALPQTIAPMPTTAGAAVSALIPYLAVRDARAAIAWYTDALGAPGRRRPVRHGRRPDRARRARRRRRQALPRRRAPRDRRRRPGRGRVSVSLHLDGARRRRRGRPGRAPRRHARAAPVVRRPVRPAPA